MGRSVDLVLGGLVCGVHGGQEVAHRRLGGEVDREDPAALLVEDEFGGSVSERDLASGTYAVLPPG
jgi:hypothetical protein